MDDKKEVNSYKSRDIKNLVEYFSSFSFVGSGTSLFALLIRWIRGDNWTIQVVCYTIVPLAFMSFLYVVSALVIKKKYNLKVPYISKTWKIVTFIFLIIYVVANVAMWNSSKKNILPGINLSEINDIPIKNDEKWNGRYYLIFSSQNCVFCNQMEQLYIDIHKKYPDITLYYVDLTYEPLSSSALQDRKIMSMPSIVCYLDDEEVDRIEGLASYEMLEAFVDRMEGG